MRFIARNASAHHKSCKKSPPQFHLVSLQNRYSSPFPFVDFSGNLYSTALCVPWTPGLTLLSWSTHGLTFTGYYPLPLPSSLFPFLIFCHVSRGRSGRKRPCRQRCCSLGCASASSSASTCWCGARSPVEQFLGPPCSPCASCGLAYR